MQYNIVGGSLPAVIIQLSPGETIVSEVGGRTWARGPVLTETKGGSVGKAFGRILSGESLFLNHYTAQGPAEIAFSSSFPGRIVARVLGPGESVICQTSAFLCASLGVELSVHFQKKLASGMFGGEGMTEAMREVLPDASRQIVFVTTSHDTRFDAAGVIRPLLGGE